ncbi:hypothetical protein Poli38472_014534 [Pythium oligandrum]|uniref:Uncharacterized protein n=1 Tax=Pythium oligandrum TaxID=41045 RepID=A0A8K1CEH7_PYTOL|nr:hypothetical protein Poli38472_014534 [Pythium oligandrum]|eukprot:TMW61073.1 hypothetical protein Poli38472_014534 [Pythium oligandrum]
MDMRTPAFLPYAVWTYQETRPSLFGSRWTHVDVQVWTEPLVVDGLLQTTAVKIQVGDRTFVLANARIDSSVRGVDRKQIRLDVHTVDDVERATRYHTAARTTTVDVFVDSEADRTAVIQTLHSLLIATKTRSHPVSSPLPPPMPAPPRTPASTVTTTSVRQQLDAAFSALSDAQTQREAGDLAAAIALYQQAERGFGAVAPLVTDVRTRELIQTQRAEIATVVTRLNAQQTMEHTLPEPPMPPVPEMTPEPQGDITQRLAQLQTFADGREVDRAQRERRPNADDLRLRLQALRGDPATTSSAADLHERLRRLRGADASALALETIPVTTTSAVDRIVQQAMEEVALGLIEDEEQEEQDINSSDSSDEDTSDEEEERRSPRPSRFHC